MNINITNGKNQLGSLHAKILDARRLRKLKHIFDKGHQLKSDKLLARYELLQSELAAEVNDFEELGRRILNFQKSVLNWATGINFDG